MQEVREAELAAAGANGKATYAKQALHRMTHGSEAQVEGGSSQSAEVTRASVNKAKTAAAGATAMASQAKQALHRMAILPPIDYTFENDLVRQLIEGATGAVDPTQATRALQDDGILGSATQLFNLIQIAQTKEMIVAAVDKLKNEGRLRNTFQVVALRNALSAEQLVAVASKLCQTVDVAKNLSVLADRLSQLLVNGEVPDSETFNLDATLSQIGCKRMMTLTELAAAVKANVYGAEKQKLHSMLSLMKNDRAVLDVFSQITPNMERQFPVCLFRRDPDSFHSRASLLRRDPHSLLHLHHIPYDKLARVALYTILVSKPAASTLILELASHIAKVGVEDTQSSKVGASGSTRHGLFGTAVKLASIAAYAKSTSAVSHAMKNFKSTGGLGNVSRIC